MPTISRSALVPFSADKMYGLVADIRRYPEFLKWCCGAEVITESETEVVASVSIDFKGITKSFTTCNRMHPHHMIEMSLVEGPFSDLSGTWRFAALEKNASKIEFDMVFNFNNPVVARLVGPVFTHIANHQVEAFTRRAQDFYGSQANDQY